MKIIDYLPSTITSEQLQTSENVETTKTFQQLLKAKIQLAQQLTNDLNSGTMSLYAQNGMNSFFDLLSSMRINHEASPFRSFTNPVVGNFMSQGWNSVLSTYSPTTTATNVFSKNASKYSDIVREAARTYGVDEKLIHAVIQIESSYNPRAKSRAGAAGLMQLMPQTARSLGVRNIFDPRQNIFGGTKYLHDMLNKFNGKLELALAAYNAGPGNVQKYGGIPPFAETQNYVKNVLKLYRA